jgi:WD40 repeat protein
MAFSRDGHRLAAAGSSVQVWDLRQSGAEPVVLRGHTRSNSVAFSPDGQRVASGGSDGTVRVSPPWDKLADAVCTMVWRNLTKEEWSVFVGEAIEYERTCKELPEGE